MMETYCKSEDMLPVTINMLPNEILFHIFSFLENEELVNSVQYTCRRWKDIAQDWRLWKNFTFEPHYKMSDAEVVNFLKQAPELRSFMQQIRKMETYAIINALCFYCPNMREVTFNYDVTYNHIIKLLDGLPKLEHLSFKTHDFCNRKVIERISGCHTLKSLEITGNEFDSSDGITMWKLLAEGAPSLERIDITSNKFDPISVENLTYLIDHKKDKLVSLKVEICEINQQYVNQFFRCAKLEELHILCGDLYVVKNIKINCHNKLSKLKYLSLLYFLNTIEEFLLTCSWPHLTKLDLSGSVLTKRIITVVINQCPKLTHLELAVTDITAQDLKDISKLANLRHLNLEQCYNVTDDIVECVSRCTKLSFVNLSCCNELTDVAVEHLLHCGSLQHIALAHCTQLTGKYFNLIPAFLPHLIFIDVDFCSIKRTILKKLHKNMPSLKMKTNTKIF